MRTRLRLPLAALCALLLAGCSLAWPEASGGAENEERFVGFYLVREDEASARQGFHQNPNLTEYGSSQVTLGGYGSFAIPKEVLFAREEGNQWVFPGLEGWRLFMLTGTGEDGGAYTDLISDMAPGKEGTQVHVTDGGTTYALSGTVYCGPPPGAENWDPYRDDSSLWTAYRVYQAPDGRPYLDGSGNSFGGGGGFSFSGSEERTITENGSSTTERIEVSVQVEVIDRLEKLVVSQFDAENALLYAGELTLAADLPEVRCMPEAAWVLVEEHRGGGVVRTAYTLPGAEEDPVSHQLVLLDGRGAGHTAELTIARPAGAGSRG